MLEPRSKFEPLEAIDLFSESVGLQEMSGSKMRNDRIFMHCEVGNMRLIFSIRQLGNTGYGNDSHSYLNENISHFSLCQWKDTTVQSRHDFSPKPI